MSQPSVSSVHVPTASNRVARLRNLRYKRIDLVDQGASQDMRTGEGAHVLLYKRAEPMRVSKAEWDSGYVTSLPDSSFAAVESDGTRHLPYKDKGGNVDLPHLRNALARLNQTNIPDSL